MPRDRDLPQTTDLLTWEQGEAVLEAAAKSSRESHVRDLAFLTVQRRLSLTTGQVQALRVADYDREARRLTVVDRYGKNPKVRDASSASAALDNWLDERNSARVWSFVRDSPALFVGRQGPLVERTLREYFKVYAQEAGLDESTHLNAIRQPVPSDNPGFHISLISTVEIAVAPAGVWSPKPLQPFKPKADTHYEVEIVGGPKVRSREHETLVNEFASWLRIAHGYEPMRSSQIDLALESPQVVVEAKYVPDDEDWLNSIRQAVGQLYEYRFFELVAPKCPLLFLASNRVPDRLLRYLEEDRKIAVAWRNMDTFELTERAKTILQIED